MPRPSIDAPLPGRTFDCRATRPMSLSTQLSLLEDLTSPRQQVAWPIFLNRYGGIVVGWSLQWGASPEEAEDIAQETLLRVFLHIGQFQHRGRYSFRSWLKTIARNVWLKLVQERFRGEALPDVGGLGGGDGGGGGQVQFSLLSLQARENLENLFNEMATHEIFEMAAQRVKSRISHTTWKIFCMCELDEIPGPEVARSLDVTLVTVHHATSRVRAMLRQEIGRIDPPTDPRSIKD